MHERRKNVRTSELIHHPCCLADALSAEAEARGTNRTTLDHSVPCNIRNQSYLVALHIPLLIIGQQQQHLPWKYDSQHAYLTVP